MIPSKIGASFLETLRNEDDLKDIASELYETAFDEFLDDGLAKNLPVVELIRKACRVYSSYSNFLLTKKLVSFLTMLSDVPAEQRRKQIDELDRNPLYRARVGENLLLLIDKLDDMGKPDLLGKAWLAFLSEKIDSTTLFRTQRAIDQISMIDVPLLRDLYKDQTSSTGLKRCPYRTPESGVIEPPYHVTPNEDAVDDETWQRLVQLSICGLLDMVYGRGGGVGGRVGGLRKNNLGKIFVEIVVS